jgi:Spy/CpxP family protein refolding chaperone
MRMSPEERTMRSVREKNAGDRRGAMEAVRSIRDKSDGEIERILTAEQKKKFAEWKKNRPEPGRRER